MKNLSLNPANHRSETKSKSLLTVAIHENSCLFTSHGQVALCTTEKNTINKSWTRTRDLTEYLSKIRYPISCAHMLGRAITAIKYYIVCCFSKIQANSVIHIYQ